MPQLTAPNAHQRAIIKRRGLNPADYLVVKDLNYTLIIKHRVTGRIKLLDRNNI